MINTIAAIAEAKGIQVSSVQKQITRKGFPKFAVDEPLPENLVNQLLKSKQPGSAKDSQKPQEEAPQVRPPKKEIKPLAETKEKKGLLAYLPLLPLPMLGLAASYGVYFFAAQFVPVYIAIIEAFAFELVYIGLGSIRNPKPKRAKLIQRVSLAAVAVSVVYNTIAAALHQNPGLLSGAGPIVIWVISIIHGAPLAILGYYVNHLNFYND